MSLRRVLVTGSRAWPAADHQVITVVLNDEAALHGPLIVIHGACDTGVDVIASQWARRTNSPEWRFPADWKRHAAAAGPIRNRQMVEEALPDVVLAFPLERSIGTWDCVNAAKAAGVPAVVWWPVGAHTEVPG